MTRVTHQLIVPSIAAVALVLFIVNFDPIDSGTRTEASEQSELPSPAVYDELPYDFEVARVGAVEGTSFSYLIVRRLTDGAEFTAFAGGTTPIVGSRVRLVDITYHQHENLPKRLLVVKTNH